MPVRTSQVKNAALAPPLHTAHDLYKASLGPSEISLDIPADATLTQIEHSLEIAITGFNRLGEARESLKPIIGRLLLAVKANKLYKGTYKNFTEFIMKQVIEKYQLGRSNAFEALRIAEKFPSLSATEYEQIGASRLLLAARVTDESKEDYKKILSDSRKVSVEEFRARVTSMLIPTTAEGAASPTTQTVTIRASLEGAARWKSLIENSTVSAADWFDRLLDAYIVSQRPAPQRGRPRTTAGTMTPTVRRRTVSSH